MLDMKIMIYIDILPKELRDILDLYINFPLWCVFDKILRDNYIVTDGHNDLIDISKMLKENYAKHLDKSNIKYKEIFVGPYYKDRYHVHYELLSTQLVTIRTLVNYFNNVSNSSPSYAVSSYQIADINSLLRDLQWEEQILTHITKADKDSHGHTHKKYFVFNLNS